MRMKSRITTFLMLGAFSATLLACNLLGTKNAGELSNTGISGTVSFGPISPVAVEGESNTSPFQANIHVVDSAENLVHSFSSDDSGNFHVILEPGNYILMPQVENVGDLAPSWPRSKPYSVQVNLGSFTEVNIDYDSGIR